jgi:hypothetical protein
MLPTADAGQAGLQFATDHVGSCVSIRSEVGEIGPSSKFTALASLRRRLRVRKCSLVLRFFPHAPQFVKVIFPGDHGCTR